MRGILALLFAAAGLQATTYYVTVAGLGGEPEYEQRFSGWAKDIDKALKTGNPDAKVETLYGAAATRAKLQSTLGDIAHQAKPDDAFILMLIGHGTFDGIEYKINLPGPDLSATDIAALLDRIPAKRQLVVNMTSASGGSLAALTRPSRAVITATKTGTEKNATIFARYWAEALHDPAADTDKNDVISALEAYRYADEKTTRFFETQKRLATEHAMLEDTGNKNGARKPGAQNGQGLLAARFPMAHLGGSAVTANPANRQLLAHKEDLESKIDALKYQKAALPETEYRQQLSALLLDLARTQAALDKQ